MAYEYESRRKLKKYLKLFVKNRSMKMCNENIVSRNS